MKVESKESFKLLQLSDDSKSLSDLELPEIANQRKRKVRRKTRTRASSIRHDDERNGSHIDCKNFGLWLAILMTILWLFIISYITSVVHNENRRLEIAIQKVSATSQNVPEALQKWHETSKNLEQNQTALNGKLREIQQVLSNFSIELKQLRDTIEQKNENSQEAQLTNLKTNVADLGSRIGDDRARIASLEESFTTTQSQQKSLEQSVKDLQTVFAQIRNNSIAESFSGAQSNATEQSIANIRVQLSAQIANLAQNFTSEIQTLMQRNEWLGNDTATQKNRIDKLLVDSANVSSHVDSLKNTWAEIRNNLTGLEGGYRQMSEQIERLQNVSKDFTLSMGSIREQCDRYHGESEVLGNELSSIKGRLEQIEKKETPPTATTVNATEEAQKDTIPKNLSQLFNPPTPSSFAKSTKSAAGDQEAKRQDISMAAGQQPAKVSGTTSTAILHPSVAAPSASSTVTTTTTTGAISSAKNDDINARM